MPRATRRAPGFRPLLERTPALLLLDLSNLYANARNFGYDWRDWLSGIPLERIAYCHLAGGVERGELYHDTHAHPLPDDACELVEWLCERADPPGLMIERDDNFPPPEELRAELDAVRSARDRARSAEEAKAGVSR